MSAHTDAHLNNAALGGKVETQDPMRRILELARPSMESLADDSRDRCTQYAYLLAQIATIARGNHA